ncbi:hypothetical protein E1176_14850 [Fulvivirga sp. RKSG066]|uniref:hypothetical protein n=1 Tax=Fulvivirga aurantia TaxID=2529383 RepID=UPI0012BD52E1|nr:hypothetical protein [Fulvivirga aurantia]MTI22308.1 hypothetical protein [Fulvivirga aurantia]
MRFLILILGVLFSFQLSAQDVPYMAQDDFEFELDYQFEKKPPPSQNKVDLEKRTTYSADLLPYVRVNLKFINPPDEAFRVRVTSSDGALIRSKRLKNLETLALDLGFADDIKDRTKPHAFFIYLENKEKQRLSKIKIFVEETGDFYLNDKLFGKI